MKRLSTLSLLLTASFLVLAVHGFAEDPAPWQYASPPATFGEFLTPEPPSPAVAQQPFVGGEPQTASDIVVPDMEQFAPDRRPSVTQESSSIVLVASDSPGLGVPGVVRILPPITPPKQNAAITDPSYTRLASLSIPVVESPSSVSSMAHEPPPLGTPILVSQEVVSEQVVLNAAPAQPAICGCGYSHESHDYDDPSCRVPEGAPGVVVDESWKTPHDGYIHSYRAVGAPCSTCMLGVHGQPCGRCDTCRGPGRIETWWITRAKPRLQESHWGYPEEFEERPFGSLVRAHVNQQIRNGTRDRMVLYRYDFHNGGLGDESMLNPTGLRRLDDLRRMMRCNSTPLVIEPSGKNSKLDAARREHVLSLLQDSSFAVPEDWVVVARPNARGMHGEDALRVHQRMLSGAAPVSSDRSSSASSDDSTSSGSSGGSGSGGSSN